MPVWDPWTSRMAIVARREVPARPAQAQRTGEDAVSSTTLADLPDVNDLVDVTLDSRAEPLAAMVGAVARDPMLLAEPIDRTGRIVLPGTGECGLLVWGEAGNLRQAPMEVLETSGRPDPSWRV